MNSCGTCTMCCRLLAVTELVKPKNTPCLNCAVGVGCKIYDVRPVSCQTFRCIWLQTQTAGPVALPLNLRPDKSKVVLHMTPDEKHFVAKVDPKYPSAWQESGIAYLLTKLSERMLVLVDNGKHYWVIDHHHAREVQMSAADSDGIEHFQGYL